MKLIETQQSMIADLTPMVDNYNRCFGDFERAFIIEKQQ